MTFRTAGDEAIGRADFRAGHTSAALHLLRSFLGRPAIILCRAATVNVSFIREFIFITDAPPCYVYSVLIPLMR